MTFVICNNAQYQILKAGAAGMGLPAATAGQYDWSAQDELLLYVIHGSLHLIGHNDQTPGEREQMRSQERRWLLEMGITPNASLSPRDHLGG